MSDETFWCFQTYWGPIVGSDDILAAQKETGHTVMPKHRKPCIVVLLLI